MDRSNLRFEEGMEESQTDRQQSQADLRSALAEIEALHTQVTNVRCTGNRILFNDTLRFDSTSFYFITFRKAQEIRIIRTAKLFGILHIVLCFLPYTILYHLLECNYK